MSVSLSTSQQQREQKTFTGLGIASYLDRTFLNANVSADIDGSWSGDASARRVLFNQNVNVGFGYTAEDYGSISDADVPAQYRFNASMRGRAPFISGSYSLGTAYSASEDGIVRQENSASLSTRVSRMSVSTNLTHAIRKSDAGESESLRGETSIGGRLGRTRWRGSADYSIAPDGWSMNRYNLNLSRGLMKDVSGILALQNEPDTDLTSGTAAVVWNGKYARISPKVSYDSENNLGVFLDSSFGLAYDDYTNSIIMRGKDLSKFGGVSAFVFLDRDGNKKYEAETDEPIPEAIVEALHSNKSSTTDEQGEAFLYDLPSNIITDVRLNEFSFFDPLFVPGFDGVSIRPRPGHETRIEFPVHNGGEMDGTIYVRPPQGKERPLRNVRVYLYDMDGRLQHSATTSFDGFYLFTKIHPGRYYLIVDDRDATNFGLMQPLPQEVAFGYEGTIIYGRNIIIDKASPDTTDGIPVNIGTDIAEFVSANPSLNPALLEGRPIMLNLGSYRSNLLMTLVWYRLKTRYNAIIGDADLLVDPAQSYVSLATGLHTLRIRLPHYDIQEAWQRCRALTARGLYCAVEIMPQPEGQEEAAAGQSKG
jgi:hypothetical protein